VAVGPNASDPHYGPVEKTAAPIREGELLLLDVWAKEEKFRAALLRCHVTGFLGAKVPRKRESFWRGAPGEDKATT